MRHILEGMINMEPILSVKNLEFYYDKIHALENVSFDVYPGEIVTMIGSNGAGKTTLLRSISGLLGKIAGGSVTFEGKKIDRLPPNKIAGLKLGQVLEGRLVFPQLTVKENLMMGAFLQTDKKFTHEKMEYCYDLFPRLKERELQNAGTLSGGEQQMLAVARALMGDPKLLMLDEPSMGLAPLVIREIFSIIQKSTRTELPFFWSSRMRIPLLRLLTEPMSWKSGSWFWKGPPMN